MWKGGDGEHFLEGVSSSATEREGGKVSRVGWTSTVIPCLPEELKEAHLRETNTNITLKSTRNILYFKIWKTMKQDK